MLTLKSFSGKELSPEEVVQLRRLVDEGEPLGLVVLRNVEKKHGMYLTVPTLLATIDRLAHEVDTREWAESISSAEMWQVYNYRLQHDPDNLDIRLAQLRLAEPTRGMRKTIRELEVRIEEKNKRKD